MQASRNTENRLIGPQLYIRNNFVQSSPERIDYDQVDAVRRSPTPFLANRGILLQPSEINHPFRINRLCHFNYHSPCLWTPTNNIHDILPYSFGVTPMPVYSIPEHFQYSSFDSTRSVLNKSLKGGLYVNMNQHKSHLSSNPEDDQLIIRKPELRMGHEITVINNKDYSSSEKPLNSEQRFFKLKYFKTLAVVISKILKNEELPTNSLKLSLEEREILSAFINKRYRLKESYRVPKGSDLTNNLITDLPRRLKKYNYGKRKEENMKLVFNWVFKFLKTQIAATCPDKPSKDELDYLFYTHYFRQVAEQHGLNIISFYKPNFVKPVKNSEKTFNANFIKNIQLSEHFMADFMLALNEYMLTEYKTVIDKKLFAIFVKWEAKLEKDEYSPKSLLSLARSITGSQKCKLPWTLTEIQLAISCVKSELSSRL